MCVYCVCVLSLLQWLYKLRLFVAQRLFANMYSATAAAAAAAADQQRRG